MPDSFEQLYNNLKAFDSIKAADKIINKNSHYAIDLIQGQMIRGRMPDDSLIGTYKSPLYAEFKSLKNSLAGYGVMDFNLEGNYYKKMKMQGQYPNYTIISLDSKAGKLVEIAGDDPLGLNKTSAVLFRDNNDKDFIEEVAKLFK